MSARPVMELLIDENVPEAVTEFLRSRGHNIEMVRNVLPVGTEDPVVATVGNRFSKTIVTWDKGFDKAARPRQKNTQQNQTRYRKLGQIVLDCKYAQGLDVLQEHIEIVETYYATALAKNKKLLVTLRVDGFKMRWR